MRWLTFSVFAAVVWVGQTTLVPRLTVGGVRLDGVLLFAVFCGLYAPRRDSAVAGWVLGMGADLMSVERLGMMSIVYCLVAVAVGSVRDLVFLKTMGTHFLVTLAAGISATGSVTVYRAFMYPGSVGGWWMGIVEGATVSLYTAVLATLVFPTLLRCSRILGLQASRSAGYGGAIVGGTRV